MASEKATSSLRIQSKSSGSWCSTKPATRKRWLTGQTKCSTLPLT